MSCRAVSAADPKISLMAGTGRVAITVSVRELKEALVDNTLDDLMGATTGSTLKLRPTDDLELSVVVGRIDRRRVHGRSRILSLVPCNKMVTALRDLSDAGRGLRGLTERRSSGPPG
jgi:hypothetical protein